jgi:NAD(P)-dependent dehydrogenase (short-subunit alcohol dehydrogenase family)
MPVRRFQCRASGERFASSQRRSARRIAVNTVAPGAVATDFSGGVVRDNPNVNKLVTEMTALGRAGLPDDIGPMIASLLSEDNRWVNAQRIEVSGGMSI